MRVKRKTLYVGAFLLATGATVLVAQAGLVDDATIIAALGLWPVLLVVAGAALLLRGTRLAIVGGLVAAMTPGLLVGGAMAAAPNVALACDAGEPGGTSTRDGAFDGSARVELDLSCGELDLGTSPGTAWQVTTTTDSRTPVIEANANWLRVATTVRGPRFGWDWQSDAWQVVLPRDVELDLSSELNAARATLDLSGARLGDLVLDVNAGDVTVNLADATVRRVRLETNAASARVELPGTSDLELSIEANASSVSICAPETVGLQVRHERSLADISLPGLVRVGNAWQSPNYDLAPHHADVTIVANVGSVDLNPEGGCK